MSHQYLSTACLHTQHDYCKGETGAVGKKKPAECKFCAAKCICHCHTAQPASTPLNSVGTADTAVKET